MTHPLTPRENLMRPIAGIENRTAQEVFDIMSDRFRAHLTALASGSGDHCGDITDMIGSGDQIPGPDEVTAPSSMGWLSAQGEAARADRAEAKVAFYEANTNGISVRRTPPMTADLSALIARLEAAEVGSRELDWAVGAALFTGVRGCAAPNATTSLDAALALAERVLPGSRCLAGTRGLKGDRARAAVVPEAGRMAGAKAPTPALALCIAILRAKQGEG